MAAGCHPVPELTWGEGSQGGCVSIFMFMFVFVAGMFGLGMFIWATDKTDANPRMARWQGSKRTWTPHAWKMNVLWGPRYDGRHRGSAP
jgi:hypothetical protein